jgi:DNA-binding PadR family transcriptional regulator
MSEPTFLVLTALAKEPMHGYAIMRTIRALSQGRTALPVGTLYGVLDRLVEEGLAERDREEIHQGRLRRYYRLTEDGYLALAEETRRLAANVRAATTALKARDLRPSPAGGAE